MEYDARRTQSLPRAALPLEAVEEVEQGARMHVDVLLRVFVAVLLGNQPLLISCSEMVSGSLRSMTSPGPLM